MKRYLRINMIDGSSADFEIKRAIEIDLPAPTLEFRQLKGGGFQVPILKILLEI